MSSLLLHCTFGARSRVVQIVLCADSPPSDTLKLYCWDDPMQRTACYNQDPSACTFSFSWAVTPVVYVANPPVGMSADALTLHSNALDAVTAVWLVASWGRVSCPLAEAHSTNRTCTVPDMPAGQYKVGRSHIQLMWRKQPAHPCDLQTQRFLFSIERGDA